MNEHYFPAHASRPVETLVVPPPTAWATGAEMMAQLFAELKRRASP